MTLTESYESDPNDIWGMLRMVSADGQVDNRIMDTSTLPGRTLRMVGLTIGGLVVGVMAAYVVFMAMLTWLLGSLSW